MSDQRHDLIRDELPDYVAGTADPSRQAEIRERLEKDADLRAEAELVRIMRTHRPEPPADLTDRIRSGLRAGESGRLRTGWQLSTAAVLILALGTTLLWRTRPRDAGTLPLDEPVASVLPADDGLVAGAALLDDLSDEDLRTLLEELGG